MSEDAGLRPGRLTTITTPANAARVAWLLLPALTTLLLAVRGGTQDGDWYPWALVVTLAAGAALLSDVLRPRLGAGAVASAAFAGLAAWTMISTAWALLPGAAFVEGARAAFYAAVFVLVLAAVRRARDARTVVLGVGAVCGALSLVVTVRLAHAPPAGWFTYDRLSWPTGYPNTAASLEVLAFWLLAGVACLRRAPIWVRAGAQGIAAVALGTGLLTESRGALYAFALATPIALVVLRERLRLAVPLAIAAASLIPAAPALRDAFGTGPSPAMQHAARVVLAAGLLAAVLGAVAAIIDRRLELTPERRRLVGRAALVAAVVAVVLGGIVGLSRGVPHRADTAWRTFSGQSTGDTSNVHLFSFGSNRYDFWRVALDDMGRHPLLGEGAGSFGPTYLVHGRSSEQPAQAHGEVFELLSTLGLPGLILGGICGLIGLVGLSGWWSPLRDRYDVVIAGGFAAALSVLIHAQADWHWQSTTIALPLVAVLAAGAALASGERRAGIWPTRIAGGLLVLAAVVWILPGLLSIRYSSDAVAHADVTAAHRAADLDPFADDGLLIAAQIERATGRRDAALADARAAASREPHDWTAWVAVQQLAPTAAERLAACQHARRENPRLAACASAPAG